jgi:hypothetical protein
MSNELTVDTRPSMISDGEVISGLTHAEIAVEFIIMTSVPCGLAGCNKHKL